jgi:hypothetical protein
MHGIKQSPCQGCNPLGFHTLIIIGTNVCKQFRHSKERISVAKARLRIAATGKVLPNDPFNQCLMKMLSHDRRSAAGSGDQIRDVKSFDTPSTFLRPMASRWQPPLTLSGLGLAMRSHGAFKSRSRKAAGSASSVRIIAGSGSDGTNRGVRRIRLGEDSAILGVPRRRPSALRRSA